MTTEFSDHEPQNEQELKQLLFSRELALLADLKARVGDESAMTNSVETVLVQVLRTAEAKDHERVAAALAPLIISSMRSEIRNSRDMMVEALYPITGRLISAAVKDAIKKAFEQVDERLDSALSLDRWRARVISKFTGRSQAEVLFRYRPVFRIEAFLLADRTTGTPIARFGGFGAGDSAGDDELFAGMLNATLTFARNALRETEGGDLRRLNFGGAELFLRTSPTLLLAVRANGPAPIDIDDRLEQVFVNFLSAHREIIDVEGPINPDVGQHLSDDLHARLDGVSSKSAKDSKGLPWKGILLGVAAALALAWFGGTALLAERSRMQLLKNASLAIASFPSLNGYRIDAAVDGPDLKVSGLAPTAADAMALREKLDQVAAEAGVTLTVNLNTLPTPAEQSATAVAAELLPDVDKRIAPLSRSVADVAFRTQDIEESVESAAGQTVRLAAEVASLQAALAASQASLEAAAADAAAAQQQLAADLSVRLGAVDGAVAALERSDDRAAERLTETRTALQAARDQLVGVNQSIQDVKTSDETLAAKLADTRKALDIASAQIAAIGASLGETSVQTRALQSDTTAGIQTLAGRIETAEQAIADRAAAATQQAADLIAVTERLETEAARVSDAEQQLAALGSLPQEAAETASGVAALTGALEGLQAQIQQDAKRLAAAEAQLAKIGSVPLPDIEAQSLALAESRELAERLAVLEASLVEVRAAAGTAEPELVARLEDLETRAGDAIALLDQRIDRIARAAQPTAESPVDTANRALRPLVVVFASGDQPNDSDQARDVLRAVAEVVLSMPASVKLRIMGYADSDGAVEANRITSQRRSDWAFNALLRLGVPPERMVSVGRGSERLLTAGSDENSPNRRVEFESFYAIKSSGDN